MRQFVQTCNYYYSIGNNGDCQFVFLIALDKSGRISYTPVFDSY